MERWLWTVLRAEQVSCQDEAKLALLVKEAEEGETKARSTQWEEEENEMNRCSYMYLQYKGLSLS